MKKLLLSALLTLPIAANAINCEEFGEITAGVMKLRQQGVPMSQVVEGAPTLKNITIMAYNRPAYSSEALQKKEIKRFRNLFELACYEKELDK